MRFRSLSLAVSALSLAVLAACSTAVTRGTDDDLGGSGDQKDAGINLGAGDGGGIVTPATPIGSLTGTVFAPNGSLPLAGAVVYLSEVKPAAIPTAAFCDKCLDLTNMQFTNSKSDGTFKLEFFKAQKMYLVVQKGAFRRVREVNLVAGEQGVPAETTTLPSTTSGDDNAPRMAVVKAPSSSYDQIELSLAKLGLTQVDLIDANASTSFIQSATKLSKYHVVFLPCGAGSMTSCGDERTTAAAAKTALRSFVQGGGRLYVTDFSYEYVKQTWPKPITWGTGGTSWSQDGRGEACISSWDGQAQWKDASLGAWMSEPTVNGSATVELEGNWSWIKGVSTYSAQDENGVTQDLTPKVWANGRRGGNYEPTTVSFQDKCGRVLFSTYHSENHGGTQLLPQEKALLYILLEVNTCVGEPSIPQ